MSIKLTFVAMATAFKMRGITSPITVWFIEYTPFWYSGRGVDKKMRGL